MPAGMSTIRHYQIKSQILLGELQWLGLLGGVRVLVALVDLQLAENVAAHLALGEHAAHGQLDQLLGVQLVPSS